MNDDLIKPSIFSDDEALIKNSILIVDDEPSNVRILLSMFESEYTVYLANDGETGVQMAKDWQPDLILLDIVLPGMDGYQVLKILKGAEETERIPVIFISGLSSSEEEEYGLKLGAVDYIIRPFDSSITKIRVRHQLQIINQFRLIERLSMLDHLTEIPNRRSFTYRMGIEWARAVRDKTPLSVLMIDIDFFKKYNDTYGHVQGDAALQVVAWTFTHTMKRRSDFGARWGGEEFVALLPNTTVEGALELAEQIRVAVGGAEIGLPEGKISNVTVSIGCYTVIPERDSNMNDIIYKADEALYRAKNSGRNKVCV